MSLSHVGIQQILSHVYVAIIFLLCKQRQGLCKHMVFIPDWQSAHPSDLQYFLMQKMYIIFRQVYLHKLGQSAVDRD